MRTLRSSISRRLLARGIPIAALACAVPAALFAQVTVTPFGGAYAPTGNLVNETVEMAEGTGNLKLKQELGFVAGGSVHGWMNERFGLKGTFGYGWSDLKVTGLLTDRAQGLGGSITESGSVMLGSAKMLVRVAGEQFGPQMFYLGVGPSFIRRDSDFYDALEDVSIDGLSDFGGAIEFAGDFRLTENVRLHAGMESFLYSAQLKASDDVTGESVTFDSKFQGDFMGAVGLSFRFGGPVGEAPPVIANRQR